MERGGEEGEGRGGRGGGEGRGRGGGEKGRGGGKVSKAAGVDRREFWISREIERMQGGGEKGGSGEILDYLVRKCVGFPEGKIDRLISR